MNLAGGCEPL